MAYSAGSKSSNVRDLILLMCTPMDRWTPEQSMHTRHPIFSDTQSGLGRLHSAQFGLFERIFSIAGLIKALLDATVDICFSLEDLDPRLESIDTEC